MSYITTFSKSFLGILRCFVEVLLFLEIFKKLSAFSESFCNFLIHFDFSTFCLYFSYFLFGICFYRLDFDLCLDACGSWYVGWCVWDVGTMLSKSVGAMVAMALAIKSRYVSSIRSMSLCEVGTRKVRLIGHICGGFRFSFFLSNIFNIFCFNTFYFYWGILLALATRHLLYFFVWHLKDINCEI